MFIYALSTCSLKNILHSTWWVIAPPTLTVLSMFYTNRGFFSLFSLNLFSFTNFVSMNRPIALLSNNAFTATPSWLFSFSSSTFIYTSLSSYSVCHTSLILSVLPWQETLFSSFSGCNTLYIFEKASQELTVLHCLLLTFMAFLLFFLLFFSSVNSFWLYGPIFYIYSMFYPPSSPINIYYIGVSF